MATNLDDEYDYTDDEVAAGDEVAAAAVDQVETTDSSSAVIDQLLVDEQRRKRQAASVAAAASNEPGVPGAGAPEPEPPSKARQVYDYMVKNAGFDIDFATFEQNIQDREKAKQVYDYMAKNAGFDIGEEAFYNELKKKGGASSAPGSVAKASPSVLSKDSTGVTSLADVPGTAGTAPIGQDGAVTTAAVPANGAASRPAWALLTDRQQKIFKTAGGHNMNPQQQEELAAQIRITTPATLEEKIPTQNFADGYADLSFEPALKTLDPTLLNPRQQREFAAKGGSVMEPAHRDQLLESILNKPKTDRDEIEDSYNTLAAFIHPENLKSLQQSFNQIDANSRNKDAFSKSIDAELAKDGITQGNPLYQDAYRQKAAQMQQGDPDLMQSIRTALDNQDYGVANQQLQAAAEKAKSQIHEPSFLERFSLAPMAVVDRTREQFETAAINASLNNAQDAIKRLSYPKFASWGDVVKAGQEAPLAPIGEPENAHKISEFLTENQQSGMWFAREMNNQVYRDYRQNLIDGLRTDPQTGNPFYMTWDAHPEKNPNWKEMKYSLEKQGREINGYAASQQINQLSTVRDTEAVPAMLNAIKAREQAISDGTYYQGNNKASLEKAVEDATTNVQVINQQIESFSKAGKATNDSLYDKYKEQVERDKEVEWRNITGEDDRGYLMGGFVRPMARDFVEAFEGVKHVLFSPDSNERQDIAREAKEWGSYSYIPQQQQTFQPSMLQQVSDNHKANIDAILKSDMSEAQKKKSFVQYISANPDAIEAVPNPKAGEMNLTKATWVNESANLFRNLIEFYTIDRLTGHIGTQLKAASPALAAVAEGTVGAEARAARAAQANRVYDGLDNAIDAAHAAGEFNAAIASDLKTVNNIGRAAWVDASPHQIVADFMNSGVPVMVAKQIPKVVVFGGMRYADFYNESIQAGKSPEEAANFAKGMVGLHGLMAVFNPEPEKILGFAGITEGAASKITMSEYAKILGPETRNALRQVIGTGEALTQSYVKNYAQVMAPIALQTIGTVVGENIIRKTTNTNYSDAYTAYEEGKKALVSSMIGGVFLGLGGTIRGAQTHLDAYRDATWFAAVQGETMKEHIDRDFAMGNITEAEATARKQYVSTAQRVKNSIPMDFEGRPLGPVAERDWVQRKTELEYYKEARKQLQQEIGDGKMTKEQSKAMDHLEEMMFETQSDLYKIRDNTYNTFKEGLARRTGWVVPGSTDYNRASAGIAPELNIKVGDPIVVPGGKKLTVTSYGPDHLELDDGSGNPVRFDSLADFKESFVDHVYDSYDQFSELNPTVFRAPSIRSRAAREATEANPLSTLSNVPDDIRDRTPLSNLASEFESADPVMKDVYNWASQHAGQKGEGLMIRYENRGAEYPHPAEYDKLTKEIILNADDPNVKKMTRDDMREYVGHEMIHAAQEESFVRNPELRKEYEKRAEALVTALRKIDTGAIDDPHTAEYLQKIREMQTDELLTYAMVNPQLREFLGKVEYQYGAPSAAEKAAGVKNTALKEIDALVDTYVRPGIESTTPKGEPVNRQHMSEEPQVDPDKPVYERGTDPLAFARKMKTYNRNKKIAEEAAAAEARKQNISSSDERLYRSQVTRDAKTLKGMEGELTPDAFNAKANYEPGTLEPFVAALKHLAENKEANGDDKVLQKRALDALNAVRKNPETREAAIRAEVNAIHKQYTEGEELFNKQVSLARQLAQNAGDAVRRALRSSNKERVDEINKIYQQKLDKAVADWKGTPAGLDAKIEKIRNEHAKEVEVQRQVHLKNLAELRSRKRDTEAQLQEKLQDLTDRKQLYRDRIMQTIEAYRKLNLLKDGSYDGRQVLKLLDVATADMSDEGFLRVANILHGMTTQADYQAKVKRVQEAQAQLRQLRNSKSLTGNDVGFIKAVLQYSPLDVSDVGKFADLLEAMVQDRKNFDAGKPRTFSNANVLLFLEGEGRKVVQGKAKLAEEKYNEIYNSKGFASMMNAGKLTGFPDQETFTDQMKGAMASANPKEAVDAIHAKLSNIQNRLREMNANNFSKGEFDFNADNAPEKGSYKPEDANRTAVKALFKKVISDNMYQILARDGHVKNFPSEKDFNDQVDAASINDLMKMGKNIRDMNGILNDYRANRKGESNIDEVPELDFNSEETYRPEDKQSQNFKQRYRKLTEDADFIDMSEKDQIKNFPNEKEFDEMVAKASSDEVAKKNLGKKLRDLENAVRNKAENNRQQQENAEPSDVNDAADIDFNDESTYSPKKASQLDRATANQHAIDLNKEDWTPEQREALKMMKDMDLSKMDNSQLRFFNNQLRNVIDNNDYTGIGILKAMHRATRSEDRAAFNKLIDEEHYTIGQAKYKGPKILQKFMNSTPISDLIMSRLAGSPRLLTALMKTVGLEDIRNGYVKSSNDMHNLYDIRLAEILNKFQLKKNDKDLQTDLTLYSWINQNQDGSREHQTNELYRRMTEVLNDITRKRRHGTEKDIEEANRIEDRFRKMTDKLDEVYGIKTIEKDDNGNLVINKLAVTELSPQKIREAKVIGEGEQKIYDLFRENYDRIKPAFLKVRREYDNKPIDDLFNNYMKDSIRILRPDSKTAVTDPTEIMKNGNYNNERDAANMDNTATYTRVKGNRFPVDDNGKPMDRLEGRDQAHSEEGLGSAMHVINTDFFRSQEKNLKSMHDDVNTLEHLHRAKEVFNDKDFIRQIGGEDNLNFLRQTLNREAMIMSGTNPEKASEATKAIVPIANFIRRMAARRNLSGFMQYVTQAGSQLGNAIGDLAAKGHPMLMAQLASERYSNPEVAKALESLTDQALVKLRGENVGGTKNIMDEQGYSLTEAIGGDGEWVKTYRDLKEQINHQLKLKNKYTGEESARMLGFLQAGDTQAAKATYQAYYAYYLLHNKVYRDAGSIDWKKEAESPNRDAQIFAQNELANLQNANSRASMAQFLNNPNETGLKVILGAFAGFNMNKSAQYSDAIRQWRTAKNIDNLQQRAEQTAQAQQRISGLLVEDLMYNGMMKPAQKWVLGVGARAAMNALGFGNLEDMKEMKRAAKYGKKGGIGGDMFRGIVNAAVQNVTGRYLNIGTKLAEAAINSALKIGGKEPFFYDQGGTDYGSFTAAFQGYPADIKRMIMLATHANKSDARDWSVAIGKLISEYLATKGLNEATINRTADKIAQKYDQDILQKKFNLDSENYPKRK